LNQESITRFIERFRAHNVTQFFRSEEAPTESPEDGVLKVVGSTFIAEVIKGRTNTLVLFWDSKDVGASSTYDTLLRELSASINVEKRDVLKICTFDLALNEVY
jgi:hypothetical protein